MLRLFDLWERTFSPFLPESELAHVNAAPTRLVAVSPLFARVVDVALDAARLTDGLVDPTFGSPAVDWTSLRLTGRVLRRRRGTTLDLNGVVKGIAADAALELISGPGFVRPAATSRAAAPPSLAFPAEAHCGSQTAGWRRAARRTGRAT